MQSIKPTISTTTITCGTTIASTAVTSSAGFGSVVAGQKVFGAGIPYGTTVVTVTDTSNIVISNKATATAASASLQFSYYTSAAYTAGDCVGFPFEIGMQKINQIVVVDNDKVVATNLKFYIFDGLPAVTLDNAAFAPSDADAAKLVGVVTVSTFTTLGNNIIGLSAATDQPVWVNTAKVKYCQIVCGGTPTFSAVDSLTINIMGE
jgi:hypothetical protein